MASLFPRPAALAFCLAWLAAAAPAQDVLPQLQSTLPINLDADSSEFDRRRDRLLFRGLRISQGALGIQADEAEASRLDFGDSLWIFRGNVVIQNGDTVVRCERAEMTFKGHQLRNAKLAGAPASFEQRPAAGGEATRGRAGQLDYNLGNGVISMAGDAWLSDGANEISGNRITYDLRREFVIADAEGNGQVRMKINPPEREARP